MNFRPAEKKNERHHFLALDGLRGVAAFIVMSFHGCAIFGISNVVNSAYMAVDFFFLLSGFVIAYAYDQRLSGKSMTWWQFMTARMIRLYPMLFVGTAAGLFVFVALQIRHAEFGIVISLLAGMGSFALLPVGLVLSTIAYPVNLPVWSLFFEFSVNALYGSRFGRLGKHSLVAFVALSGAALMAVTMWGGPSFRAWLGKSRRIRVRVCKGLLSVLGWRSTLSCRAGPHVTERADWRDRLNSGRAAPGANQWFSLRPVADAGGIPDADRIRLLRQSGKFGGARLFCPGAVVLSALPRPLASLSDHRRNVTDDAPRHLSMGADDWWRGRGGRRRGGLVGSF